MWQDAEIKYSPKGSHRSFNLKNNVFKIAYFCENICRQELSKIAQSGHTGKDTFWREKEEEIEARVSGPLMSSVIRKNLQMSIKLPKNDFSRKIIDFDNFTKIA